jgi:hypothetical protein
MHGICVVVSHFLWFFYKPNWNCIPSVGFWGGMWLNFIKYTKRKCWLIKSMAWIRKQEDTYMYIVIPTCRPCYASKKITKNEIRLHKYRALQIKKTFRSFNLVFNCFLQILACPICYQLVRFLKHCLVTHQR